MPDFDKLNADSIAATGQPFVNCFGPPEVVAAFEKWKLEKGVSSMNPQALRLLTAIREIFGDNVARWNIRNEPIYAKGEIVAIGWRIDFAVPEEPQTDAPIVSWDNPPQDIKASMRQLAEKIVQEA